MNHLPTELLHGIFIKLDLTDKLECMLVCRFWYDTLDRRTLLDTLVIPKHIFPRLKEMIERQPHRANQVEQLKIHPTPRLDFDKRIICNMFPNLREVIFGYESERPFERTNYMENPFQFTHAASKLELIEDFGECELTRQLAISNMCGNLTSLEIDFVTLRLSTSILIHDLKNMPVLEELSLCNIRVGLMGLEIMHDNLPSIRYLNLENLNLTSGEIPRNVMPASLVIDMNLFLEEVDNLHTHLQFYKYMVKKYPSLHHPNFHDLATRFEERQYTFDTCHNGLFFFYQNVGHKADLATFANYYSGLDVFSRFDTLGMKIMELRLETHDDEGDVLFIEQLVQSQQRKYVEGLYLTNIIPQPMYMLSNMEALTNLEMEYYRFLELETIDFNQFLGVCPATLMSLKMDGADLMFDESTIPVTSIHNLKLIGIELTPALVKTIETSFPVLSTFELWCNMKENRTISLPNHYLKDATFTIVQTRKRSGFSIKKRSDGKPNYFTRSEMPRSFENKRTELMAVSEEEFDDPLVLNFICASVEELSLYSSF